jgi:hypothetical protein
VYLPASDRLEASAAANTLGTGRVARTLGVGYEEQLGVRIVSTEQLPFVDVEFFPGCFNRPLAIRFTDESYHHGRVTVDRTVEAMAQLDRVAPRNPRIGERSCNFTT